MRKVLLAILLVVAGAAGGFFFRSYQSRPMLIQCTDVNAKPIAPFVLPNAPKKFEPITTPQPTVYSADELIAFTSRVVIVAVNGKPATVIIVSVTGETAIFAAGDCQRNEKCNAVVLAKIKADVDGSTLDVVNLNLPLASQT